MATSLINDSERAGKIMSHLIDVATLLYYPRDKLVNDMQDKHIQAETAPLAQT